MILNRWEEYSCDKWKRVVIVYKDKVNYCLLENRYMTTNMKCIPGDDRVTVVYTMERI